MSTYDYTDLQYEVDQVVGKLGLNKTVSLLKSFVNNAECQKAPITKQPTVIKSFLVSECIELFELLEEDFYSSNIREYREARMICYHLMRKHTNLTLAKIGEMFGITRRQVLYFCKKAGDEYLSEPKFHEDFCKVYNLIENNLIVFISGLNLT